MNFKTFIKTTEAVIVLGGLFLTFVLGKFWIIPTAIAYTVANVPNIWNSIKNKF